MKAATAKSHGGLMKSEARMITASDLRRRLELFENRYGIPSDRLAEAFTNQAGLRETDDFHSWSILYGAWQAVTKSRPS
jgi:hypothetical protein